MLEKIVFGLKSILGLTDWLTFIRHLILSSYSWILSPVLFQYLNGIVAGLIMFIFTIIITDIFLRISVGRTEKSILLKLVGWVYKKRKLYVTGTLFILEPFLFIIYFRDNYHQYGNTTNRNFWFYLLLITSSLIATILWAAFIYFTGFRI